MNYQKTIKQLLSSFVLGAVRTDLSECIESIVQHTDEIIVALGVPLDLSLEVEAMMPEVQSTLANHGISKCKIVLTNPTRREFDKRRAIPGVKNVVVVASGKGGVGKSTIAFNLAIALSTLGKSVALVDIDIYGPSLPSLSGVTRKPILKNNKMVPWLKFGIKMMSAGFLIEEDEALIWRGPMATKMLAQLLQSTDWQDDGRQCEYLIIDTPPGTADVHLSLLENYFVDGAIIVSTPQKLAVADVRRCMTMFSKFHIPILGMVQNYSMVETEMGGGMMIFGDGHENTKLAKQFDTAIIASIPLDVGINDSAIKHKPLPIYQPSSKFSKEMQRLSEHVMQHFYSAN